jgi:ABC-type multidrug transport system fused ATPase/permease subunit
MEDYERTLKAIREEGNARMSDAKAIAGVTSEVGVEEMKDSFWQYITAGKQFAKRQSMWDMMFMAMRSLGQRHRDESTAEFVVRFLMQVLINFSMGLVMAFVFFVIGLWSIIRSYQPNPLVAVVVFICASCAAFSFVASYLLAIYGAAAGGVYGLAKMAENQARIQNGGQRQYMQNRAHYD